MIEGLILFVAIGWAILHIINSIDDKQRRARQQQELRDYRDEMVRNGNYTDEDIRQRLSYMREKHRYENM